ncbi:uracil-DNA glycosylase family protein [Novosphingobium profundi]|uniref:uracil-DNA glycosylase family protein n=1 Tax=Novosphingobium profundi TaxID=1774954 RepID=UPI001CFCED17|nr:uracil-DNA glycosylase family protein [Novosphingobium profundi]
MDHGSNQHFLSDITGALDWWRLAGVDCDYVDDPQDWLAPPEEELPPPSEWSIARAENEAKAAAAPENARRIDTEALPATLEAFTPWWKAEPLLAPGALETRIAPVGKAGAEVMVIVEAPEREDREGLLTGPQGQLLDAILASVGISREDAYLTSALPRAMPAPDWAEARALGLGDVLMHHIGLVGPKRLFVLGGNVPALLGHESPQRAAVSRKFNHQGTSIPLLASWGLDSLLNRPRTKPVLWKAMLDWIAT